MIVVLGGGPAGASAAIAGRLAGEEVLLVEKSKFPRHKVCGEFLSPEARPLLERAGVSIERASSIRRVHMRFARVEKTFRLPEPALGISRYALDAALLDRAVACGAQVALHGPAAQVIAHGRQTPSLRGRRLFGFKAHFSGPVNDAVELYFFRGGYAGLNAVEDGATNVCGVLPEDVLAGCGFDVDAAVRSFEPLADRLVPMSRTMRWLTVAPLVFEQRTEAAGDKYLAGDALSFVDPFTGSGMLCAIVSGRMAGEAAVRKTPVEKYLAECRRSLARPFEMSSLFRQVLVSGWAERLAPFVPGAVLYRLTRPRFAQQ